MTLGRALSSGRFFKRKRSRGGDAWVLDWRGADGRRHREMLGTDRRVAERRAQEIIRARDLELAGLGSVEGQSRPLEELKEAYLADLRTRVTPAHAVNVSASLERTLGELGAVRVRDLRPYDAIRYRGKLGATGLANRTVNLHVDRLGAMLNWGSKVGLIAENPLARLERLPEGPKHQRRRRRALSDEEIERFLAAAAEDDRVQAARVAAERTIQNGTKGAGYAAAGRRERIPQLPLWRAFLETAARYGELTTATWGDVDLEAGVLTLRAEETKAGRERQIPLLDELVGELRALRAVHERALGAAGAGDPVFLTPSGVAWPKPSNNLSRVFRRLLGAAGIDRVDAHGRRLDVHALRHTAATRLARAGVGLVSAQRILGHSDPKLTAQVYTHTRVEDLRAEIKRVPTLYRSNEQSQSAELVPEASPLIWSRAECDPLDGQQDSCPVED